jgi:predicted  nucleic acid-binding Zn-ribbon protein
MDKVKRVIIAKKKRINFNNPNLGVVHPLAESIGDYYQTLSTENFCETGEVFITGSYQTHIDDKFSDEEIFKITVHESLHVSNSISEGNENNASKCKYVANGFEVESLKPKDIAHVISVSGLPDPNRRFIELEFLPSTPYIYLQDESLICYGPFKWIKEDGGFLIQFIDAPFPVYRNLPKSHVFKFDKQSFLNCIFEGDDISFVVNMNDIHNKAEFYDYSCDEDVVKYFIQQASECGFKVEKIQLQSLESAFKRSPKAPFKNPLFRKNFERLEGVVKDFESNRDQIVDGVVKFFKSDVGLEIVGAYVSKNEEKYLDFIKQKHKAEIEKSTQQKKVDYELLSAKHNNLNAEINKLSKDLERLKEQKEIGSEEDYLEKDKKIDENLKIKIDEISNLQREIDLLSQKYKSLKTLSDVEKEVEEKKQDMKFLNRHIVELEANKKTLQAQINEDMQKKVVELKPYVDAINGAFIVGNANTPDVFLDIKGFKEKNISKIDRQTSVIDSIFSEVKRKSPNRQISKVDIANMLLCTQQSFIVFLAGLPGVGKTSFSRLFVDAQGLKNRFREVSVSRGWTGQKDLIGFYNPLANRFQPSQSGLYPFLMALHEESKKDPKNHAMAYVLLDEANLSPIEHYWASFMGMTDSRTNMSIQLGQDVICVPDQLRFIATINYDSTTEPLSPRVIDRAPIIVVDSYGGGDSDNVEELLCDIPISSKDLEDLFGCLSEADFDDLEDEVFLLIQNILSHSNKDLGRPIHLSARKTNAIKQYCSQARAIMRHLHLNQDDSELVALDFAVLQFVLPQIRGNGAKFKKRLDSLLKVLQDNRLVDSANYLERMISYGEDELHTYDFFCW